METTGRIGWVARGVLYLLVALLVARVPTTGSPREADQRGAFAALAESPFGGWLLAAIAAGLAAFAVFRLWESIRATDEKTGRRVGWAFSALVYANLSLAAMRVLLRRGSDSDQKALTARALSWPGGQLVVGLVGIVIIASALRFVRKGIKERFRVDVDESAVPSFAWPLVKVVGVAGWIGRGVVWSLVGWFVLRAAVQRDPNEPLGLDQTLRSLAGEGWGVVVLWISVAGLAAFGLMCLATAAWLDQRPDRPGQTS